MKFGKSIISLSILSVCVCVCVRNAAGSHAYNILSPVGPCSLALLPFWGGHHWQQSCNQCPLPTTQRRRKQFCEYRKRRGRALGSGLDGLFASTCFALRCFALLVLLAARARALHTISPHHHHHHHPHHRRPMSPPFFSFYLYLLVVRITPY